MRWDAGRIIPQGQTERFWVAKDVPRGAATLVLRTDGGGPSWIRVHVPTIELLLMGQEIAIPARDEGAWFEVHVPLGDVRGGQAIEITAVSGAWRSFHAWLVRLRY
jgi:hypothetical protein